MFVLISTVLLVAGLSILNCNGTRIRTADLGVSESQVISNLTSLSTLQITSAGSGTSFQTMLTSFMNLQKDPTTTLYYGEAPGEMADTP